jgi:hypothetical protein
MNTELLQNLLSSDIVWQILIALAMLLLFRSVPKETLDKLEKRAIETESNADDMAIKVLRWLNANKELLPTLIPDTGTTTVTTGNGTDTTITVSQPPVVMYPAPVGNTGTSTTDVSTPPFVPLPEVPHTIVRNFGVTDSSFEKTVNGTRRVIHTPVNTSPLFSTLDAAGKEYPYPSVNVNSAYGVQFDISWIAGAWGFTILETLVSGTAYKVRFDYTAQVTGAKVDSLSEWLSHELDVNGKVTGVSQGVMNGVSYAEWGITGGHLPLMITPRLRCLWALGQDESKISWQRLTITPVDYGANG